jgi:hypothetical protein
MRTYRVFGERYVFCNEGCRDAFRSDKLHRLMYPQVRISDDQTVSWAEASRQLGRCAYCRAEPAQ